MQSTRLQQRPAKGSLTKSDLSKTVFGKKTLRWMRNKRTLYYNTEILKIYQFICKTLYTFMHTFNSRPSLPQRGSNKQKRADLRQLSLALVVDEEQGLPLSSRCYEGNT